MKKILQWISNLLPLALSVISCAVFLKSGKTWFIASTDKSFHFSLITVNALFGGFLYTNYSLLVGLLDNSIINKVKNTNIIKKRNTHILKGIIYATISVIAGLYLVLVSSAESGINHIIYSFMQNVEIVFMAFLIAYFILSLHEMSMLVKSVHSPKGKKSEKEISNLIEQIKDNGDTKER